MLFEVHFPAKTFIIMESLDSLDSLDPLDSLDDQCTSFCLYGRSVARNGGKWWVYFSLGFGEKIVLNGTYGSVDRIC